MNFSGRIPFTSKAWQAAGRSRAELRTSRYTRIFRGCYIAAGTPLTPMIYAQAALLVRSDAEFVTHHTAAEILGGAVPHTAEIHLGTVCGNRSRREAVIQHRYIERPQTVVTRSGLRVTAAPQTFVDLAPELGLVDLVVLGDSLIKVGQVDAATLRNAAATATGRGGRRARRAAQLTRAGVDSPQESRLRMLMVLAGLPEPTIDIRFRDERGEICRRVESGYRERRLGIEYDGRQHIAREPNWANDILRREYFAGIDWEILTFIAADIFRHPSMTLDRIRDGMRRKGMRVPRVTDEWRRYFPDFSRQP